MPNNKDWLTLMAQQSESIPEDMDWMSAIRALAEEMETATNLTEYQQGLLVGVGALMYRQGFREFQSGTRAEIIINKAKK